MGKRSLPATLADLHLNLDCTQVTDCGVQGLMQSLPESLQKLDLSLRYIPHEAGAAAKDVMTITPALEPDLPFVDEVTDDRVQSLKQFLPESLQKLDLNLQHSVVTDSGVQGLTQSLPESLQKFSLNLESPR